MNNLIAIKTQIIMIPLIVLKIYSAHQRPCLSGKLLHNIIIRNVIL